MTSPRHPRPLSAPHRFRALRSPLRWILLGVIGIVLSGVEPAAGQRFTLQESVLGASGGTAASGSRVVTSSLGGPSPGGQADGGAVVLFSGFPSPFAGILDVRIVHAPSAPAAGVPAGEGRSITARIQTAQAPVQEAVLTYRPGDAPTPTSVPMAEEANGFVGRIPGEAVGAAGLVYFITATDANGTAVRAPRSGVYSVPVRLSGPGLVKPTAQPAGDDAGAYRLLSVPLQVDAPDPSAVLGDDIPVLADGASYDPEQARFFEPIGTRVAEFPRTADFAPGKAFWLIVRDGAADLDTGPGTVGPLNTPVTIDLEAGWNFVGSPFPLPLPVERITADPAAPLVFRSYGSDGYNTPDEAVTTLEPFAGYAVFVDGETSLRFSPPLRDDEKTGASSPPEPLTWSVRVIGRGPTGRDADNVAGVHPRAAAGRDEQDWPDPPGIGAGVRLGFVEVDAARGERRFSTDIRPPETSGAARTLQLETDTPGPVELDVQRVADVPAGLAVWLADLTTKQQWNLRRQSTVQIGHVPADTPRRMLLLIGPDPFVEARKRSAGTIPADFVLEGPYPNPSRGPVTVRFGLPKDATVTLDVYNTLGQRVAVLADRVERRAGYHTLTWNRRVASGMYFVRLRAGSYRGVQKLVRVR